MLKKRELGDLFPLTPFKFYVNGGKEHIFETRRKYREYIEVVDLDTQKIQLCLRKTKVIPLRD